MTPTKKTPTFEDVIELLREAWNAALEGARAEERERQRLQLQEIFGPPSAAGAAGPPNGLKAIHAPRIVREPKDECHADTLSGLPCKLHAVGTYHRRAMCGIHMHHARRRREEARG